MTLNSCKAWCTLTLLRSRFEAFSRNMNAQTLSLQLTMSSSNAKVFNLLKASLLQAVKCAHTNGLHASALTHPTAFQVEHVSLTCTPPVGGFCGRSGKALKARNAGKAWDMGAETDWRPGRGQFNVSERIPSLNRQTSPAPAPAPKSVTARQAGRQTGRVRAGRA